LNQQVAAFMRPVENLNSESSLDRAAAVLRNTPFGLIPIQNGNTLLGVVTESTLAEALARGCGPYDPVTVALDSKTPTIQSHETGAEALRKISESGASSLLVVDSSGRGIGIVSGSDLYPKQPYSPKPPVVGGMATPFGVYLTNGAIGAGVPYWALMSTGAVMFGLVALGGVAQTLLFHYTGADRAANYNQAWDLFPIVFLFLGMRLLPLAGIHAAEHKVVHAIERGEPLVPEVVDRMPRVHPRCGTNLFVGATIFGAVLSWPYIPDQTLRIVLAAVATFLLWQPLGSAMQWAITTRPPSRKHVEMGIKSGKELLEKYRLVRNPSPNPLQRIWNSGMVHVLSGFMICSLAAAGIAKVFHWELPF
jgi:CBS domain-containing protein